MGKSDYFGLELQKKRKMRNSRRKCRRQQRAMMKHAAASEAVGQKIQQNIKEQKELTEKYCAKWRKATKEAKDLKMKLQISQRQLHIKQIAMNVDKKHLNPVLDVNHISPDELTQLNKDASIGSGTFEECTVKLYRRFNLVVLEKQLLTTDLKAVINEAKCMHILTHPIIPQLLGVQIESKPYSLIMEFVGEDLKSSTVRQLLLETNPKHSLLLTPEWVSVCVDIVEAVNHIHSKGYLHCDLKRNNVLVLKKRGFVIDFGKACHATKPTARKYSSFYNYMAPEVLRGQPVSSSSDVFSLGVIISTIGKTLGNKSINSLGKQCKDSKPHVRPTLATLITLLQGIIEKDN